MITYIVRLPSFLWRTEIIIICFFFQVAGRKCDMRNRNWLTCGNENVAYNISQLGLVDIHKI